VVGCHNGVQVYSAAVDDARIDGQEAVSQALRAAGQVDPLPPFVPPPPGLFTSSPAAGRESETEDEDEEQHDHSLDTFQRFWQGPSAGPGAGGDDEESDGEGDLLSGQAAALVQLRHRLQKDWSQHVSLTQVSRTSHLNYQLSLA
jgi:hypothetical protein